MYQIVFNEISAAEMARIPKELQLELLAEFQFLPDDLDSLDSKAFGVIEREGRGGAPGSLPGQSLRTGWSGGPGCAGWASCSIGARGSGHAGWPGRTC